MRPTTEQLAMLESIGEPLGIAPARRRRIAQARKVAVKRPPSRRAQAGGEARKPAGSR